MHIPRSGTAGSYGNFMFNVLRNHQTAFYSGRATLHSHHQCIKFKLLCILTNTCFPFLKKRKICFLYGHTSGCETIPRRSFGLHFSNNIDHLFMYLLDICLSSLEACLFKFFVHFFIWVVFICLLLSYKCSLLEDNF